MALHGYWESATQRVVSRRRALAASGSAVGAGAFLAACGGGSKKETGPVDRSGLLFEPKETTGEARSGGVLKSNLTADILHFDGLTSTSAAVLGSATQYTYLRLVKWVTSKHPKPADGSIEGELAES